MTKTRLAFPDVTSGLIDQSQAVVDAIEALWPQPVTVGPFTVTLEECGAAVGRCDTGALNVRVSIDGGSTGLAALQSSDVLYARLHGHVTVDDRCYEVWSSSVEIAAVDGALTAKVTHPSLRTERGGHPRTATSVEAADAISAALTDWLSDMTADDLRDLSDVVSRAFKVALVAQSAWQVRHDLGDLTG